VQYISNCNTSITENTDVCCVTIELIFLTNQQFFLAQAVSFLDIW